MTDRREGSSFRDPSGFLFHREGVLYRQVNQTYQAEYDRLVESDLYDRLINKGMLIPHLEVPLQPEEPDLAYRVIRPERINFISYPYEWCFSQLKDAALLTLAIQKQVLESGMILKDASAYNIQFHRGKPILIDSLSFEIYQEGQPWVAYRQFCQHFLAPLALMSKKDVRLSQFLRVHIDGIPLDLASQLLPGGTRFNMGLQIHIHAHARAQQKYAGRRVDTRSKTMGKMGLLGIIDNLENTVRKLEWQPSGTEWGEYYTGTNYTERSFEHKKALVGQFIELSNPQQVWDLGANTGIFSRLASAREIPTVAFDVDPAAVEKNYRQVREQQETRLLPLLMDLTNPSPALGWQNRERMSLAERGPVDLVLALALVHHLAISNNVPLTQLAQFFHGLSLHLVIEFVPKQDSQVQRLLASRQDIFPDYTQAGFEKAFSACFKILESEQVEGSERTLYRMERL